MEKLLSYEIMDNTIETISICVGVIILATILSAIVKRIIKKIAQHRVLFTDWADKFLSPLFLLSAVYICLNLLTISDKIFKILSVAFIVVTTWYITRIVVNAFNFSIRKYLEKTRTEEDQNRIRPLFSFFNFLIWILGLLFILSYLGFEVATVLAGLGIGGIAIALAAQTILGDLFNYFVIFFDKPFEIGDFLVFDDKRGEVEKIGIKSTRIRMLSGEQLIISNSNLTNARVHNFKRMERRRVVFTLGVIYQTSRDKLKKIPKIIKSIVEETDLTTFDRSHFQAYGSFSLDFETVYYVQSNDYVTYMNIHQNILFRIHEEFEKESIEFAYPTQTILLNNDENRKPKTS